jgi:hypothetical protein
LSAASYIDGAGVIQLRFATDMVPYITRLEAEFTRYKLEKVAKMSSAYAIRLYELLMQWGSVGRREIELEWLRKTLMVDQDYKALCDFKKRVIDVAVTQINEHSDLTASYDQRKTGRNVTHLIFTFAPKEETQPLETATTAQDTPTDVRDSDLFKRLRNHGIGAKLAAAWIQQDKARSLAAVEYVEARAKNGQIKGSTAGYLRTVFEGGAQIGPSAFEADLTVQAREAATSARRADAEKRAKTQADRDALEQAKQAIAALSPEDYLALAAEYRQGEGRERAASWDNGKGKFRNGLESIQFKAWLQTRFKAL